MCNNSGLGLADAYAVASSSVAVNDLGLIRFIGAARDGAQGGQVRGGQDDRRRRLLQVRTSSRASLEVQSKAAPRSLRERDRTCNSSRPLLSCTLNARIPRGRVRSVALCAESAVAHVSFPLQGQVCHRHRVGCPRGDQNYGPGRAEGAEDARRRPPRGAMPVGPHQRLRAHAVLLASPACFFPSSLAHRGTLRADSGDEVDQPSKRR